MSQNVAHFFNHFNVAGRRSLCKSFQRRRTSLMMSVTSMSQDVANYISYSDVAERRTSLSHFNVAGRRLLYKLLQCRRTSQVT